MTVTQVISRDTRAYLSHMLWAPKLVYELVQGVDGQLAAQRPHLSQQVLLQPLHALQDSGAVQVPLWGDQGDWGGRARSGPRGKPAPAALSRRPGDWGSGP